MQGRPNPLHYKLPERLKRVRQGANRRALEEQAGVSNGVISSIEDDGRVPLLDTIERIARALNVSACALAYGHEGGTAAPVEAPLGCEGTGARLVAVRTARGLSLRALAKAASMTPSGISSIETGRSMPSVATSEQLARALGLSPCWLAYGEGPEVLPKREQRKSVKKTTTDLLRLARKPTPGRTRKRTQESG